MSLVPLPATLEPFLAPYLPPPQHRGLWVTLTYAQLVDGCIAAAPGTRTAILHAETKTMTHFLRHHHSHILVGVATAVADDPKLNCRYGSHMIRPVVVDPHRRWRYARSQLHRLVGQGQGLAPWIVTAETGGEGASEDAEALAADGGRYLHVAATDGRFSWSSVFAALRAQGADSVMVEGGALVIEQLLGEALLVDSLVVTIGPVYLGAGGVRVSPPRPTRLAEVAWWHGVEDAVFAAHIAGI